MFRSCDRPISVDPRAGSRGQSIVELAIVLPVVLLIVLIAMDFGRAYLGWVVVNNAARVGANYAALHADAWDTPGDAAERAAYDALVNGARAEAAASLGGCDTAPIPAPAFPSGKDIGDHAVVTLDCQYSPITPFIGNLLGAVNVTATSLFPIRIGALEGPVLSPSPPCPALADFTWSVDVADPLRVNFQDSSVPPGAASGWIWAFGDPSGNASANQNPSYAYASGGTYTVRLDVNGCSSMSKDVSVTEPTPSVSPDPNASPSASPSPSPTPGCVVPGFTSVRKNAAQELWEDDHGFSTAVIFDPDPPGNWIIQAQSLVGGQPAPCNVTITLGPNPIPTQAP